MALELHLVGTFHCDLQGQNRLQKLLSILSPDIVSVEYDPESVSQLNQLEKYKQSAEGMEIVIADFCKNGNYHPETVRRSIPNLYFEYFASKEYCKKNHKPLIFSDTGDRILGQQNVEYIFSTPPQKIQQQTEIGYQNQVLEMLPENIPDLLKRDAYTEVILRALSGKVVHVAGAWHLLGNYHNLYERLKNLNPIRMMLNQADFL
ncbi:MAG: hypothetical protein AABX31_01030 [Nanoarchaeota archaeon]